jgi:hypothetical protein
MNASGKVTKKVDPETSLRETTTVGARRKRAGPDKIKIIKWQTKRKGSKKER